MYMNKRGTDTFTYLQPIWLGPPANQAKLLEKKKKASNSLLLWDEVFPHMLHQLKMQHAFSLQCLPVLSECLLLTLPWFDSDHHLANVN